MFSNFLFFHAGTPKIIFHILMNPYQQKTKTKKREAVDGVRRLFQSCQLPTKIPTIFRRTQCLEFFTVLQDFYLFPLRYLEEPVTTEYSGTASGLVAI
jgi:hypothetical protein